MAAKQTRVKSGIPPEHVITHPDADWPQFESARESSAGGWLLYQVDQALYEDVYYSLRSSNSLHGMIARSVSLPVITVSLSLLH